MATPDKRQERKGKARADEARAQAERAARRSLAKNRDERYATMGELAGAIAPFGSPNAAHRAERVARTGEPARLGVISTPELTSGAFAETMASIPADGTAATSAPWATRSAIEIVPAERATRGTLGIAATALGALGLAFFLGRGAAPAIPAASSTERPLAAPSESEVAAAPTIVVSPSVSVNIPQPPSVPAASATAASKADGRPPPRPRAGAIGPGGAATPSAAKTFGPDDWGDRK